MSFKPMIFTAVLMTALSMSSTLFAKDCKTILSKLPKHTAETNDQAKMVQDFEKNCKQRQDVTDQQSYNQCVTVGMRAMAVAGNFVAAEKMAQIECEAGNDKISKTWMGMVVGNQNATQEDKDVAQEAIDNNTE